MLSINPRRLLSQAALVLGVLLLSAGVQTFAAFSEPSVAPPGADANAPLTTGPNAEAKEGGLLLNTSGAENGLIVQLGNVGIGTGAPTQMLDVAGYVKGTGLCIADDCRTAWDSVSASGASSQTIYDTPGTYTLTVPAGLTAMKVELLGGGGGGGGASYGDSGDYFGGGGGGAGTVVRGVLNDLTTGSTYTLTVGSKGKGGASVYNVNPQNYASATSGGATKISSDTADLLSAAGGNAGKNSTGLSAGTGGSIGGQSGFGSKGGKGGDSGFGTGGAPGTGAKGSNGSPATGNGAGGGGGSGIPYEWSPSAGGAGSPGRAVIEFFDPNGPVPRDEFNALLVKLNEQGIKTE